MPPSKPKTKKRRRYPAHRIKQTQSYDPAEIAKLFGIHKNTVRHWLKTGLKAIDDRRPVLVHGATFKAFISERQKSRRQGEGVSWGLDIRPGFPPTVSAADDG